MRKFSLLILFIVAIVVVSCTTSGNGTDSGMGQISLQNQPSPQNARTATPEITVTPSPLPTSTMTETSVPTATPMGGKPLQIAYLSFDCEDVDSENCIIIADVFTNEVKFKFPVNALTIDAYISWSPDGKYLLYTDRWESYINVMLLDMETRESILIDTYLLRMPTVLVSDTGSVKKYGIFAPNNTVDFTKWSPDGKYVVYQTTVPSGGSSIFLYSLEDHGIKKLENFTSAFYWLDDSENLLDITGHLYNVITEKFTTIPHVFFMRATTFDGDSIKIMHGDSSYYPDTVSLLSPSSDLERLMEEGTGILYEDELVIAKVYKENPKEDLVKHYSISVNNYFIEGNKIILSGYFRHEEPRTDEQFIKIGNMDELPLIISKDDLFEGNIFMLSPDGRFFFGSDVALKKDIFTEKYTKIYLINCYDIETLEIIHTYDVHTLAEDPHEVRYINNRNLAFHWVE